MVCKLILNSLPLLSWFYKFLKDYAAISAFTYSQKLNPLFFVVLSDFITKTLTGPTSVIVTFNYSSS